MSSVAHVQQSTAVYQAPQAAKPEPSDSKPANPYMGSRQNDGYQSFGGSVLRNTLIGAGMGAVAALPLGPISVPVGAAIGGAAGAGSALIRHPRVANAVGDGVKGAMAGATGGAVVGMVTPLGPVGGAAVGGAGGFATGLASGMLKTVNGGKHSIEGQTTVGGRMLQGAKLGALAGGTVGFGASFLMGGVTAVPGALIGAAIGGVGGALYGAMSGVTDAATGAKGARFTGGGSLPGLPSLPGFPGGGTAPGGKDDVHQDVSQGDVTQYCPPAGKK